MTVNGKWHYLYRAIGREGNLVAVFLGKKRDKETAKTFFRQALENRPEGLARVTTDGCDSCSDAIDKVFEDPLTHRYLNHPLERDHRGVKQLHDVMRKFNRFPLAQCFAIAFDDIRNFFRYRPHRKPSQSLASQKQIHQDRFARIMAIMHSFQ